MIKTYVYTSCTSCRKTVDVLNSANVDVHHRDFFRDRFTRDELSAILEKAGLKPFDILSRRSKVYKARSAEIDGLSETQLLEMMIEEPTLLRRPLVIDGEHVIVGHNPKLLDEMIAATR